MVRSWQLFILLFNLRSGTEVATTAFHMWHRGGMQTLWPRDEALERTRVVVEL